MNISGEWPAFWVTKMNSQTIATSALQGHFEHPSVLPQRGTVPAQIRHYAEIQPDHSAIVASGFTPLSYRELEYQIKEVRKALRLAGFSRSARIAIAMPNGPQAALAIVAVSCSAISIPVNPRQTLPEIEKGFAALRPDAVLMLEGSDCTARRVAERNDIIVIDATPSDDGTLGFAIVKPERRLAETHDETDEPDSEAPAFILQTSGTTSEPKLIPTSHRNMLAAAARVQAWFNLTSQDRCLSVSPVFYAHGLHVTVFAPLLSGGTIAFPADASKFDHLEWFEKLRPTWYSAGPTLHRLVFDQTKSQVDGNLRHSLRLIVSGGAPLPPDVLEGLQQAFSVPVLEHYGSSEGMQICANQLPPGRSKPGTCGIPWPNTIIIVGENGQQLPPGEEGEILVGGPTVISGYLNAPELSRACFVDGWFKSGDIGSVDKDGFLTLHGRKSDLINRGGEKISPIEVDEALMCHPAVAEAAAFPVAHPRLGEDVAAAVVLRPDMTATPIELRRFLHDRVASFKVPRRIIIRDQLPKGATGKVLRHQLKDSFGEEPAAERQVAALPLVENTSADDALVSELVELWKRLLKVEYLSLDDDFFEKGGDSLLAMEMLLDLESLTSLTVSSSIFFEATTIRELANKLSERNSLRPKFIIKMHSGGRQTPLVYFHGNFNGLGHSALTLANVLGPDQPLLVVVPHGTGDEPIPDSIEAMAADRLPLIMNAQPEGPYRLCGNCLGGIVAFEVARMLIAAGKKVEMVVMLDAPTINARKSVQLLLSIMRCVRPIAGLVVERAMALTWYRCAQLQRFWNYSWTRRQASIRRRWVAFKCKAQNFTSGSTDQTSTASTAVDRHGKSSTETSELGQFTDRRTVRYSAAMSNYLPKPLAVRTIYFKLDFGIGAWRRISPDLDVIKSVGTHELPDFTYVAENLRERLRAGK